MKVSIVTPSYQQGEFIEETIKSVINQDYSPLEHVVVDGGSTDETVQVLSEYEDQYDLRWLSEPDEGQADGVNKGVDMTDGDIIGWLNSDDVYFSKDTVSTVVDRFELTTADAIYGDSVLITRDGVVQKINCPPSQFDYERLIRGCFLVQPSVFLRREVLEKHKLDTDREYGMDYDLWLTIGEEYDFQYVPKILSGDRNHQGRKTIDGATGMREEDKEIRENYGGSDNLGFANCIDIAEQGMLRLKGMYRFLITDLDEVACGVRFTSRTFFNQLLLTQSSLEQITNE